MTVHSPASVAARWSALGGSVTVTVAAPVCCTSKSRRPKPGAILTTIDSPREYLRELIRRDQEEQAKKRLRELIEQGLNSGPGQALTSERAAQLKKQALRKLR